MAGEQSFLWLPYEGESAKNNKLSSDLRSRARRQVMIYGRKKGKTRRLEDEVNALEKETTSSESTDESRSLRRSTTLALTPATSRSRSTTPPHGSALLLNRNESPRLDNVGTRTAKALSSTSSRTILEALAAEAYFPKDDSLHLGFSFIQGNALENKACAVTWDLCCSLLAGIWKKDDRLLQYAARLYPQSISLIRKELGHGRFSTSNLGVAVHLLQMCEEFKGLSTGGQCRQHTSGMNAVVVHAASNKSPMGLESLISSNFRQFGLWEALSTRQSMPKYDTVWKSGLPQVAFSFYTDFNQLAAQIPGSLERADFAMEYRDRDEAVLCLEQMSELKGRLHQWMKDEYTRSPEFLYRQRLLPLDGNEDCEPGSPSVRYDFGTLGIASVHLCYWACILTLQECEILLHKFSTEREPLLTSHMLRLGLKIAESAADDIMAGIHGVLESRFEYMGFMLTGSALRLVRRWYKSRANELRLVECNLIASRLSSMGFDTSPSDDWKPESPVT